MLFSFLFLIRVSSFLNGFGIGFQTNRPSRTIDLVERYETSSEWTPLPPHPLPPPNASARQIRWPCGGAGRRGQPHKHTTNKQQTNKQTTKKQTTNKQTTNNKQTNKQRQTNKHTLIKSKYEQGRLAHLHPPRVQRSLLARQFRNSHQSKQSQSQQTRPRSSSPRLTGKTESRPASSTRCTTKPRPATQMRCLLTLSKPTKLP